MGGAAAPDQLAHGEVDALGLDLGEDGEAAGDLAGADRPDLLAVEEDVSGDGPEEAGESPQERGLAASVGADDGDELAAFEVEGDLVDGVAAVVAEAEVLGGQFHGYTLNRTRYRRKGAPMAAVMIPIGISEGVMTSFATRSAAVTMTAPTRAEAGIR